MSKPEILRMVFGLFMSPINPHDWKAFARQWLESQGVEAASGGLDRRPFNPSNPDTNNRMGDPSRHESVSPSQQ